MLNLYKVIGKITLTLLFAWLGWLLGSMIPSYQISAGRPVVWHWRNINDIIACVDFVTADDPQRRTSRTCGKMIELWSLTGQKIAQLPTECTWKYDGFLKWSVSVDGDYLAEVVMGNTGIAETSGPTTIRVRQFSDGKTIDEIMINSRPDDINLSFAPSDHRLSVIDRAKQTAFIRDPKKRQTICELEGSVGATTQLQFPERGTLVGGYRGLWDATTGKRLTVPPGEYELSVDGRIALCHNTVGKQIESCQVIDTSTGNVMSTLEPYSTTDNRTSARLIVTPDLKVLGLANRGWRVVPILWDARTGNLESKVDGTEWFGFSWQLDQKVGYFDCVHPVYWNTRALLGARIDRMIQIHQFIDLETRKTIVSKTAFSDVTMINRSKNRLIQTAAYNSSTLNVYEFNQRSYFNWLGMIIGGGVPQLFFSGVNAIRRSRQSKARRTQ